MRAGCPFITCAIRKKKIEFCWQCDENGTCEKWRAHREFSRKYDTFICYQKLDDNIDSIKQHGVDAFEKSQQMRENLLKDMLSNFNEGRSKTYYSISATLLEITELKAALAQAGNDSDGLTIQERSKLLHTIIDQIAEDKRYYLGLRKPGKKAGKSSTHR